MKILEVTTEHTGPFKVLIEVLKDMLQETNIEFKYDGNDADITDKKKSTVAKSAKTAKSVKPIDTPKSTDTVKPAKTVKSAKSLKNKSKSKLDPLEAELLGNEIDDDTTTTQGNSEIDNEAEITDAVEDDDLDTTNSEAADATENEEADISKDKSGMRIMAVDTSKTVLINLKLEAKNFFTFKCTKKRFIIGVNLVCFYKLIKSMDKKDILSLYVEHDDKSNLGIQIKNTDEKKETKYKLKLLDLDDVKMTIPDVIFDAVVTMNSSEFHKICREMNQIADYVELQCLRDKIIFKCKGDYAERETIYKNSDGESDQSSVNINHASTNPTSTNAPDIVQGVFELKNLVLFSKCASLCTDIEIYLKNNYPLVIKYTVATLGRILLCLTPIKPDNTKNANYSDEDNYYSDQEEN